MKLRAKTLAIMPILNSNGGGDGGDDGTTDINDDYGNITMIKIIK